MTVWTLAASLALAAEPASALDCAVSPCAEVLPAAVRFEAVAGRPVQVGLDAAGEPVGWVARSTDVVDVKGYSGKPLQTLVGLDTRGVITGVRVLSHAEPILLVGIPESALRDFVAQYEGLSADERVSVGGAAEGAREVDIISGATVTVLSENRTILDTARMVAESEGVISPRPPVPGHFVRSDQVWSWETLEDSGAFGRLVVRSEEMGQPADEQPFIDLRFAIADAPQVGRALLGDPVYDRAMAEVQPGQHLFVILGNGTSSFKGSGFVRGGIFDRVRVEQGLSTVMFTDLDYTSLSEIPAAGAPEFAEAGLFVTRGGRLDPGRPYELVFLGSRFQTSGGGFHREFETFRAEHRLPRDLYQLDGPDPDEEIWRSSWRRSALPAALLGGWLTLVAAVFAGRRYTTASMPRLRRLHTFALLVAFLGLGLGLGAQPSVTQVLTAVGSLAHEWRWGLFLSEPLLFLSWIFIAIVTIIWGRGVFCGWTCPYGALNELLFKLGRKLRLPSYELPDRAHELARYTRYGVLLILLGLYLHDPATGERAAEIEPFKTTFLVRPWTREWMYLGWWTLLLLSSLVVWRPFCRYLCPLGAALAVPGSLRISGPHRRDFCSKCKICTRGCEPRAIRENGTIDPRECLSCMECEANWRSDQICPPLVKARRDRERAAGLP